MVKKIKQCVKAISSWQVYSLRNSADYFIHNGAWRIDTWKMATRPPSPDSRRTRVVGESLYFQGEVSMSPTTVYTVCAKLSAKKKKQVTGKVTGKGLERYQQPIYLYD